LLQKGRGEKSKVKEGVRKKKRKKKKEYVGREGEGSI